MSTQLANERFVLRATRTIPFWLPLAAMSPLFGCGDSSMSANDMRRYAMRRPADVEVKPNQASTASASKDATPPSEQKKPVAAPDSDSMDSTPPAPTLARTETTVAPAVPVDREVANPAEPPAKTVAEEPTPERPLDPESRARRTVENLSRIGAALEAYLEDKQVYPTQAISDLKGRPLLSWRVALLPYLGHEELYSQFRLTEPWNSRRNTQLLAKIPPVFQSPDRRDERTNYLVPVGTSTIFGKSHAVMASGIEDGPENTVLLLEADDAVAVPWTEPRDYLLDVSIPTRNLGSLRGDSIYVVWGGGEVGRVLTTAPRDALRAMFTYDSGENFVSGQIDKPLFDAFESSKNRPSQASGQDAMPADSANAASSNAASESARTAANPALAALAAKYFSRSSDAFAEGLERDGMQWYYAAAVVSPPGGAWVDQYQWVPALRRPLPLLRFGIGLDYTGPRERQVRDSAVATARQTSARPPKPWSTVTGDLGKQLVSELSSHWDQCCGDIVPMNSPDKSPHHRQLPRDAALLRPAHGASVAPGVYFLTVARRPVLMQMAQREAVDVLLVVQWRDAGHKWSAGISLYDVARREPILRLPTLDSAAIEKSQTDPLAKNELIETVRRLREFLAEKLAPQPLPEQIKPQHVARRLETLAAAGSEENPLAQLAEVRYYNERRLADQTQVLLAYQAIVGQKPGSELLLGDATAKERVLKPWLPAMLPTPVVTRQTASDN